MYPGSDDDMLAELDGPESAVDEETGALEGEERYEVVQINEVALTGETGEVQL